MGRKSVLVRNGQHQRPMLAVLNRYEIGQLDQYGRGRWITANDLPRIEAGMGLDPSAQRGEYNGKPYLFVKGTNIHSLVQFKDFLELFGEVS